MNYNSINRDILRKEKRAPNVDGQIQDRIYQGNTIESEALNMCLSSRHRKWPV